MNRVPFHLAIPVRDLEASRAFYCGLLQCTTGRAAARWLDLDFFGHQLTLHLVNIEEDKIATNPVDNEDIPARHFGVILDSDSWHALKSRLLAANTKFVVKPNLRFAGKLGEQHTMFLRDPHGNVLEFKSFRDQDELFQSEKT